MKQLKFPGNFLLLLMEVSNFVGGMVLHKGQIAEMRTGEGKTLVAVLPAFLNSLTGQGVHVVTVNDYLARRDCEWVGQVHRFLGLRVGLIQRTSFHLSFLSARHFHHGRKEMEFYGTVICALWCSLLRVENLCKLSPR